jgi:hypothetical protein
MMKHVRCFINNEVTNIWDPIVKNYLIQLLTVYLEQKKE